MQITGIPKKLEEIQQGLERREGNKKGTRELNAQKKYKNEGEKIQVAHRKTDKPHFFPPVSL